MTGRWRPPEHYIHAGGHIAILDGPAAAYLDDLRRAVPADVLTRLRARHLTDRRVIESQLIALGVVAEQWRQSGHGHEQAPNPDAATPSDLMDTTTAADVLGVTRRTVVRMIGDGRLLATRQAGRWLINRNDIDQAAA